MEFSPTVYLKRHNSFSQYSTFHNNIVFYLLHIASHLRNALITRPRLLNSALFPALLTALRDPESFEYCFHINHATELAMIGELIKYICSP